MTRSGNDAGLKIADAVKEQGAAAQPPPKKASFADMAREQASGLAATGRSNPTETRDEDLSNGVISKGSSDISTAARTASVDSADARRIFGGFASAVQRTPSTDSAAGRRPSAESGESRKTSNGSVVDGSRKSSGVSTASKDSIVSLSQQVRSMVLFFPDPALPCFDFLNGKRGVA